MFWTIFTILIVLSIIEISIAVGSSGYEWMFGIGLVTGLFTLMLFLGPLACETESKVSDKEEVCFNQPVFTQQAMFIYVDNGDELKGESIKDAHFPYEQAKCYKRDHYNHYGNVIKTSYIFEVGEKCKQSRTFYIKR